jgi:hypothetical protein
MIGHSYSQLVSYKRWADRGLYDVVGQKLEWLDAQEAAVLLRILDHIHVVDRIFQHHLQGLPHTFQAPRSEQIPEFPALAESVREIDDWYASYVGGNAGILLQKNGISPNDDRMTDFLESAAA